MSNPPSPKIILGGAAGAVVTILVWLASLASLTVPAEVAAAAVVVVTAVVGYLVPDPARGRHSADDGA